jgi:large subunit ribosomal protein L13
MDTLSYKTQYAKPATVEKKWLVIDAEGQVMGRFCSQVATILRGKHKASYSPHVDCGDNVIIINADKIRFTGKKWADKDYLWHTGYPGGQRTLTATEMLERDPRRPIEIAVRRMLPKSKLGREMFRNLRVYAGAEHPHEAQNPVAYQLKYDSKA